MSNWNSTYALQLYGDNEYIVKNCKLSGCNAGLLVNGSKVTLEGTIDVSGNKFGGIEVGVGSGLTSAELNLGAARLINTTETHNQPTIWTDGETAELVGGSSLYSNPNVKEGMVYYYLNESNAN